MTAIIGQKNEQPLGLQNPLRKIECGDCGSPTTVGVARQAVGTCLGCGSALCVFCGCTEEVPCFHPQHLERFTCSWHDQGVCTFCFYIIAEEMYLAATGRRAEVDKKYPTPSIIA